MEEILYFPGCGLKSGSEGFETAFLTVMNHFGFEVKEMENWVCCGAEYSLSKDDLINKVAPIRDLLRAKAQGAEKLVAPCSMCYATLKRAEKYARTQKEDMEKINNFMTEEEGEYWGGVEVIHSSELLLDLLKETDEEFTKKDLKMASYPGCTLLRPEGIAVPENIFDEILEIVGFNTVKYSEKEKCCGAFLTLFRKDITKIRSNAVISSALEAGADAIVLTCPLCEYNLAEISDLEIPIISLSQAVGLGIGEENLGLEKNRSGIKDKSLKIKR